MIKNIKQNKNAIKCPLELSKIIKPKETKISFISTDRKCVDEISRVENLNSSGNK